MDIEVDVDGKTIGQSKYVCLLVEPRPSKWKEGEGRFLGIGNRLSLG